MTLVAFQIDSLDKLNFESDTSLFLVEEALIRGYCVFTYQPHNLSLHKGALWARGQWLTKGYTLSEPELFPLNTADYVLIRQDPPFDMAYLTATYLLDHFTPQTNVINSPHGIREAPEKLLVTHFQEFTPATLISSDLTLVTAFLEEHEQAVIKPLYGFGGEDVQRIDRSNAREKAELFQKTYREPPVIQRFLPEVFEGDRRIILINGEPMGSYRRIPPANDIRSNLRLGGRDAASCDLRPRDLEICAAIGPILRQLGLFFVGIDVIGDYLTEINVTSPTGLKIYHQLTGKNLAQHFWQELVKV